MRIAGVINLVLGILLWIICIIGWTGSKEGYLIAYLLKYPAILFTVIGVVCFIIKAFTK